MPADQPDRRSRPAPPLSGARLPRRLTDRVEDAVAWLLSSAALLVGMVAVVVGMSVVRDGEVSARVEARERVQVRVVLLADADIAPAPDGYSVAQAVEVPGRWLLPDGSERVAPVRTDERAAAGTEVSRWVDRSLRPVPAPAGEGRALVDGILRAILVGLLGWAGVLLSWLGVRRWTAACNATGWAREWRRVEPTWSGRLPWQ